MTILKYISRIIPNQWKKGEREEKGVRIGDWGEERGSEAERERETEQPLLLFEADIIVNVKYPKCSTFVFWIRKWI